MSGENHISLKTYVYVLVSLLILTVLTVAVSHIDFGIFNAFISMFIATGKASLVVLFFMHMKYENWFIWSIFLLSVFFVIVLFILSQLDIVTRVVEKSVL